MKDSSVKSLPSLPSKKEAASSLPNRPVLGEAVLAEAVLQVKEGPKEFADVPRVRAGNPLVNRFRCVVEEPPHHQLNVTRVVGVVAVEEEVAEVRSAVHHLANRVVANLDRRQLSDVCFGG
ncbi:hypothetical protein TYRP_007073 [Tyrophagus putrescentiae]|nr:hypothetical protein TYRP_007073 [Tyrophagus putrescentiae]